MLRPGEGSAWAWLILDVPGWQVLQWSERVLLLL